jgi:hypothetical protein
MLFNLIAQGKTLLLKCAPKLILGALVAGVFIQPSSAQPKDPYAVAVYFGYLNNLPIGTGFPPGVDAPSPFEHDNLINPNVFLVGGSLPLDKPHDTGVIRIDNNGFFPFYVHLENLTVETDGCGVLQPWAPAQGGTRTITVARDETIVLAETNINHNFDTSECGPGKPTVKITISTDFADESRLNPLTIEDTQGVLLGKSDATDVAETTPYAMQTLQKPPIRPGIGPLVLVTGSSCSGTVAFVTIHNFGDAPAQYAGSGKVTGTKGLEELAVVTVPVPGMLGPPNGTIDPGSDVGFEFDPENPDPALFGDLMNTHYTITITPNAAGSPLDDLIKCPL